jgi:large subunit ribosomal protein L9
MKIILKANIEKLGSIGDVKEVAGGYARNYLIPKGLALPATGSNLSQMKHTMELLKNKKELEIKRIEDFVEKLNKTSVNISVETGEAGKMFGSVTREDVTEAIVRDTGIEIDKHDVLLDEPLKEISVYTVDVKIRSNNFPEEISKIAKVKVWIMDKDQKSSEQEQPSSDK